MGSRFLFTSLLLSSVTLICGTLSAQSAATATIVGRVSDPQGAMVANAPVTVRNRDTGIEQRTTTTGDGLYRFPNLSPGTYDVQVAVPGFRPSRIASLHLNVGDQRDANFRLLVAGADEAVLVTDEAPLVESSKTDVSTVIDEREMASLPFTNGFNGGVGPSNDYVNMASLTPGVRFDFTGGSTELVAPGEFNGRGNVYNIDGANITDQVTSGRDALGASIDEVKEFQVITNNYDAEYGQAGGLIVNVVTKSGTNGFHGDGHAYFRGRNLSASNYFYNLGLIENGCGGSGCSTVNGEPRAPFQKQEWGFTAGGPFIKDRTFWFGSFEKTHVAQPLTLTPPSGAVTVTQPIDEIIWSAKVDHVLTQRNRVFVRFNQQRQSQENLQVGVPSTATPESLDSFVVHDHTLNGALTSTITPHSVNESRVFWHRYFFLTSPNSTLPGQFGPNFYHGADSCCPQGGDQNRYQGVDNLTWIRGAHTLKTGVSISYMPYTSVFQQFHFGQYGSFSPEGLPTEFTVGAGPGRVRSKDNIYGVYIQDTWKLTPKLTMNYGVRYDYEAGAFKGGYIGSGGGCLQGNGIIPACSSDNDNIQPRLGLAYSPDSKTVISAGFGEITQLAFMNISLDSLNFDGVTLFTVTITDPSVLAFFPNAPPANVLAPFIPQVRTQFGRIRPIADNLHNPETRDVNLSIRRQIGDTWVVGASYIGAFGFGQFGERDRNFPAILADPAHPGFFYFGDRPDSHFTAVRTNENSRTSNYNGLVVQASKRLSNHFQFQTSYTWSHTFSSTEDFYGTSEPGDPRNIRAEMGPAENDIRNVANFTFVADAGRLVNSGFLRWVVNNWSLGWAGTIQSGRPYPISTGTGPFVGSVFPGLGNGSETQQRPNVLPDGTIVVTNIASSDGANLLVGPGGAAICRCPQTTFLAPASASPLGTVDTFSGDIVDFQFVNGNLHRNAANTSGYQRVDVSVKREFQLNPHNDALRLQLRADFFNLFNHTNFLFYNSNDVLNVMPPSTDPNCHECLNAFTGEFVGADGRILHLGDLQHGRTSADWLNPRFRGLGMPAAADKPRQIQLSLAIRW